MKPSTLFFSSLLAAAAMSTVPAFAADITVQDNTRTQVTNKDSADTYTTDKGQIYISTYGASDSSSAFNCNVVLNGEGYKNGDASNEALAALRLDLGATLAGTVTIGGNTRIWSSGGSGENVISGAISTAENATAGTLTITGTTADFNGAVCPMTFSGGMNLNKGALKFEGAGASLILSGTDKTYSAQSLASTAVGASETAPLLMVGTGVTLTLSNDKTSADADQTFSGTLEDSGTITIASGVQKFSGVQTYSTAISVSKGGTLEASGVNTLFNTVAVEGVLKASVTDAGHTPVYAGTVTFSETAKLVLDLTNASVESGVALTILSAIEIQYNNRAFSESDIRTLVDDSASIFGEYSSWKKEWKYETGQYTNSLKLTLTNVPEPSAFGLLAGVGALAFVAARRRRKKA